MNLEDAIIFAANAHKGQTRKGSLEPYILHPIRVAMHFPPQLETHRIVAVLHDVFEDTNHCLVDFAKAWAGIPTVPYALDLLTRHAEPKETYRDYIDRLATDRSGVAVAVKLADLADNLRDPYWGPPGMLAKYGEALVHLSAVARENRWVVPLT